MSTQQKPERLSSLFVLFLCLSAFTVSISNGLIVLYSVDIASTYQISQGIAVQIRTINSVGELIVGLILSFIALHFDYKKILNLGLIFVGISAVGSFFAPTFYTFLFCSFAEGAGSVLVTVMALALTGGYFSTSSNLKIRTVGWIVASGFIFNLIGLPLTNILVQIGGWRTAYLFIILPITLMSLLLSFITKASRVQNAEIPIKKDTLKIVKQLVATKSTAIYVLSWLLFAGTAPVGILAIAFYRQYFLISTDLSVVIMIIVASTSIMGSLLIEKINARFQLKFLTAALITGSGITTACLFLSPNLYLAMFFNFLAAFFISATLCSFNCLVIDKNPLFRGTIISVCRLFFVMGSVIFAAVSGYLLLVFSSMPLAVSYQATGIILGVIVTISAFVLLTQKSEVENQKAEMY